MSIHSRTDLLNRMSCAAQVAALRWVHLSAL
jgi:hypothetical protein